MNEIANASSQQPKDNGGNVELHLLEPFLFRMLGTIMLMTLRLIEIGEPPTIRHIGSGQDGNALNAFPKLYFHISRHVIALPMIALDLGHN